MESSGSMNGFLRGGVPTDFKSDLWEIINYYSNLVSAVSVLSSDGGSTKSVDLPVAQFQNPLNGGGFLSAQSTNLCEMLDSVIHNIDASKNEVAVFVSDMEYDPVGAVAPNVLQSVYSTDVATLLSNFGYSASLVAAKSNSVNKEGTSVVSGRPYYYLILGKPECVADTRNKISYLLNSNGHFIDNIETGFNYGKVPYTLGNFVGCTQVSHDPSLASISDAGCSFDIKVKLENYRWILTTDPKVLKDAFKIKSLNGARVKIDSISYEVSDVTSDKQLQRDVTANIRVSVESMPMDCDILVWNIDVPYTDISKFAPYFTDTPNSMQQTYSIKEFIIGMFRASLVCNRGGDNYIHISKK